MKETATARFYRKPCDVWELLSDVPEPSPVEVAKVIELSTAEYSYFANHLLEDAPFIASNKALMGYDEGAGITRCLLITAQSARGGILVDSQGYDYARYAAYVPDKRRLKLTEQLVERHGQKHRHSGPER